MDTITVLDNGFLKTKLYEKPTDKHMYLHKRSDHPKTVKKSIPYGLGVRVNTLAARFKFQTTLRTPQYTDVVNCWRFGRRKGTVQRLIGNDVDTVHANNLNVPVFLYSDSWLIGR